MQPMHCARIAVALTMTCLFSLASSAHQESAFAGFAEGAEAAETAPLIFATGIGDNMLQLPPVRTHHRRIRRDPYNSDGSLKYTFFAGGGFTTPTGDTADNYATGFRFQGGAGRNFNRLVAVALQFDWDGLSVRNDVLGRLLPVYQNACGTVCTGSVPAELFGSSHVWSFTVDPAYTFAGNPRTNAYVVAGIGFFHKYTQFSVPAAVSSCNGCAQSPTTQKIDSYISNAPGFNVGLGMTRQIASSDARFYGEVRYTYVKNQPRSGSATTIGPGFNAFPAGSQPTSILPVTFGIRF